MGRALGDCQSSLSQSNLSTVETSHRSAAAWIPLDFFTPAEVVLMEPLGLAERGTARKEVLAVTADLDGELPVH